MLEIGSELVARGAQESLGSSTAAHPRPSGSPWEIFAIAVARTSRKPFSDRDLVLNGSDRYIQSI